MLSLDLSAEVEQHFYEVVQRNFRGNTGEAFTSLLLLHDKYGWKEQLKEDVGAIRKEVRKKGSINSRMIDDAISKYRKAQGN